jgi:hypothetical protein
MPWAAIAAIATAAAAGTGAGLAIDQSVTAPGTPKAPVGPQPLTSPQTGAVKAAVGQEAPDIVSATGGSVSPAYTLALSQLFGGVGPTQGTSGTAQGAINNLFGLGGSGPTTAGVGTVPTTGQSFQPAGLDPNTNSNFVNDSLSTLFQQ